jgi:nucleotide-binding universal stress UspA family protein
MRGLVICGIDGSSSAGAVAVARDLAGRYQLPLQFVHVLDDRGTARYEKLVRTEHVELEYGHPADRLVALAAERDAAFVVVGCHGARSSMLGSVSADVSRRASCPVVVVPPAYEDARVAVHAVSGEGAEGLAPLPGGRAATRTARRTA